MTAIPPHTRIDILAHLKWARAIARGVRHDYGFLCGSQEELELEQTAYLVVCEYAARFDPDRVRPDSTPDKLFENWCAREVRSRCRRVAVQLQNGGTFRTTNDAEAKRMRVGGIPERCPNCADVMRGEDDEEEERPAGPPATCPAPPQQKRRYCTRTGRQIAGPPPDALAS